MRRIGAGTIRDSRQIKPATAPTWARNRMSGQPHSAAAIKGGRMVTRKKAQDQGHHPAGAIECRKPGASSMMASCRRRHQDGLKNIPRIQEIMVIEVPAVQSRVLGRPLNPASTHACLDRPTDAPQPSSSRVPAAATMMKLNRLFSSRQRPEATALAPTLRAAATGSDHAAWSWVERRSSTRLQHQPAGWASSGQTGDALPHRPDSAGHRSAARRRRCSSRR